MGFETRVNDIKSRSTSEMKRIDISKRCADLIRLEGWYQVDFDHRVLPNIVLPYFIKWKNGSRRTKFTKWLGRRTSDRDGLRIFDNRQVSMIGQLIGEQKAVTIKVSARKNDILRAPESTHFSSCFAGAETRVWSKNNGGTTYYGTGSRGVQMLRYLADPEVGIVFIPDAAGHFLWRAYMRMCEAPDSTKGWAIYKSYGNSPVSEILIEDRLNELRPLYKLTTASTIRERGFAPMMLSSIHTYNNPVVGKTVWSDHGMVYSTEARKLLFSGIPIEMDRAS